MGFEDPESLFTLEEFDMDPKRFYSLAGELLPVQNRWSPTHQFIRVLQDKGKLLRNYTQNIDNVESYAGVFPEKIIHCHGSWKTASCRKCRNKVPGEQIFDALRNKTVATCKLCAQMLSATNPMKRKRSNQGSNKARKWGDVDDDESEDDDLPEPGVMKVRETWRIRDPANIFQPDITFFGENLPDLFYDTLNNTDREAVDLIIVIGTSMKVAPVSEIPQHVKHSVPQIFISRDVSISLACYTLTKFASQFDILNLTSISLVTAILSFMSFAAAQAGTSSMPWSRLTRRLRLGRTQTLSVHILCLPESIMVPRSPSRPQRLLQPSL
jgi:NAD+-dependent protein deacetylase SIR2